MLGRLPGECCNSCIPQPGRCSTYAMQRYTSYDEYSGILPRSYCPIIFTETCENSAGFQILLEFEAERRVLFDSLFENSPPRSIRAAKRKKSKRGRRINASEVSEMNVRIFYSNYTILLSTDKHLLVNGWSVSMPYNGGVMTIIEEGMMYMITLNPGVVLRWDGNNYLEVEVQGYLQGKMCGLCGNFNKNQTDDLHR